MAKYNDLIKDGYDDKFAAYASYVDEEVRP
jgi:hypothetical protein